MKRIFLPVLIFIAVSLVFCITGVAQAKDAPVASETVNTAITTAQDLLTTEKNSLSSLPDTASQKLVQSAARRIDKAERRLNMATRAKDRGDGKTALKLTQDATTILEQVDKLIKEIQEAN
jgi:hypothetical protein